jgi:hypothetical protein
MEDTILFIIIGVGVVDMGMDTVDMVGEDVIMEHMDMLVGMVATEAIMGEVAGMGDKRDFLYYFWLVLYFIINSPTLIYWYCYRELLYIRLFFMDWFGF